MIRDFLIKDMAPLTTRLLKFVFSDAHFTLADVNR